MTLSLKELHPSLYNGISSEKFSSYFSQMKTSLKDVIPYDEFYFSLIQVLKKINDVNINVHHAKDMQEPMGVDMEKIQSPFSFKIDHNRNVGILKIRSFLSKEMNNSKKLSKKIRTIFNQLAKEDVEDLIIDVRKCDDSEKENVSQLMCGYLVDSNYTVYEKIRTQSGENITYEKFVVNQESIKWLKKQKVVDRKDSIRNIRSKWRKERTPKPNHFTGNIYVLIDEQTNGQGAELASFIHYNNDRSYFIGKETKGFYHGSTRGQFVYIKLPNTGISISIPLVDYQLKVYNYPKGRGVMPDYEILPSQTADTENDPFIEKAFSIIEARRKKD